MGGKNLLQLDSQMCFCNTKTSLRAACGGLANGSPLDHDQGQGASAAPFLDHTPGPRACRLGSGPVGPAQLARQWRRRSPLGTPSAGAVCPGAHPEMSLSGAIEEGAGPFHVRQRSAVA